MTRTLSFLCCVMLSIGQPLWAQKADAPLIERHGSADRPLSSNWNALQDQVDSLKQEVAALKKKARRFKFYGHFKIDMSHDTAQTNFGNTAYFVRNYGATLGKDDEFNMTARHTRLGLLWDGSAKGGCKQTGKVEVDFLGKSLQPNTETGELQAALRLRHAFVRVDRPRGLTLLFGHTWDVFAPLQMLKMNTLVGWGQGNVGFRRPQIRIERHRKKTNGGSTCLKLCLAEAVARDTSRDDDTTDDGEDAGLPDLQLHLSFTTPRKGKRPQARIGLGGFLGRREVAGTGVNLPFDQHYRATMLVLDLTLPLAAKLTLSGEVWAGEGVDGYRGGVFQSYVVAGGQVNKIAARGYFAQLVYKPRKRLRWVAGLGEDNPDDEDFMGLEGRWRNATIFGNVLFTCRSGTKIGLEYDRMQTDYSSNKDRTNHRVQMSFRRPF